jgi:hypothetical protein
MGRILFVIVAAGVIAASASETLAFGGGGRGRDGGGGGGRAARTSSIAVATDNDNYTSVPEPGSFVLLASAVVGLVVWARRGK